MVLALAGRFDDDDVHERSFIVAPASPAAAASQRPTVARSRCFAFSRPERDGCRGGARCGRRVPAPAAWPAPRRLHLALRTSSSTATGVGPRAARPARRQRRRGPRRGRCSAGGAVHRRAGRPRLRRQLARAGGPSCQHIGGGLGQRRAIAQQLVAAAARGSSGEPGTANTSRPCSSAKRAVISEPDLAPASTTTTPSARPAMMRLRRGKSSPAARRRAAVRGSRPAFASRHQAAILGRIDDVDAAGDHGDRAAARAPPDAPPRRCRGPARDDDDAGLASPAASRRAISLPLPRHCARRPPPPPAHAAPCRYRARRAPAAGPGLAQPLGIVRLAAESERRPQRPAPPARVRPRPGRAARPPSRLPARAAPAAPPAPARPSRTAPAGGRRSSAPTPSQRASRSQASRRRERPRDHWGASLMERNHNENGPTDHPLGAYYDKAGLGPPRPTLLQRARRIRGRGPGARRCGRSGLWHRARRARAAAPRLAGHRPSTRRRGPRPSAEAAARGLPRPIRHATAASRPPDFPPATSSTPASPSSSASGQLPVPVASHPRRAPPRRPLRRPAPRPHDSWRTRPRRRRPRPGRACRTSSPATRSSGWTARRRTARPPMARRSDGTSGTWSCGERRRTPPCP